MTWVSRDLLCQLGKVHPRFRNKLVRGKTKQNKEVFQKRHVKNKAIGINLNSRFLADKFTHRLTKPSSRLCETKKIASIAQLLLAA